MIDRIFSAEEHQILESYMINIEVNKDKLAKILNEIKTKKSLFDDVFLYLQVKKTISS